MDGIEAAQRIQKLNSDIPIVAMTANIMSNDLERYMTLGINDYIGKPFTSQELWRCLMNYFTPVTLLKEDAEQLIESDKVLRQRIIEIFVHDNETKFDEITEAVNADNIRLAHRLVHSLKGNASHLNLTRLRQIAAEVENLLSEGRNLVPLHHWSVLKHELNAALETYKPLLREPVQVTQDKEPA
jgi:CheY-like chemotaxis protein